MVAVAIALTLICAADDYATTISGGGPAAAQRRYERAKAHYRRQLGHDNNSNNVYTSTGYPFRQKQQQFFRNF